MFITYADTIGIIQVEIKAEYGISLCDGMAYFTDANGSDYMIPVSDIREIMTA